LRLLGFAARGLLDESVVIVGTYRDDEIGPDHPLSAVAAEPAGRLRHLQLSGLDADELAALVRSQPAGDGGLAAEQVADLHRVTGGNPFFAREVLVLVGGQRSRTTVQVPAGVRAVIERRLVRLSHACDDALKVAAVIGTSFSVEVVAGATGLAAVDVLGSLGEALEALVVVVEDRAPGRPDTGLRARRLARSRLASSPRRPGIAERYAREWLEQQAVTGILDVDDVGAEAKARRYALSDAHAHVLLDPDSPANTTAVAAFVAEAGRMVPAVVAAFRTGGGVPYADYAIHDLQAAFTRPVFVNNLLQEWLPALPAVHARLVAGEALRAEIGCGESIASITIARAFPNVVVHGFDLDEASIVAARKNTAEAGVASACASSCATCRTAPPPRRPTRPTTSCWRSRCSTTCPIRSVCWQPCGSWATAALSSWPTSAWPMSSPPLATRWNGSCTRRRCCTASRSAWWSRARPRPAPSSGRASFGTTPDRLGSRAEVLPVEHPPFRLYLLED
jgi:hypothetical protein